MIIIGLESRSSAIARVRAGALFAFCVVALSTLLGACTTAPGANMEPNEISVPLSQMGSKSPDAQSKRIGTLFHEYCVATEFDDGKLSRRMANDKLEELNPKTLREYSGGNAKRGWWTKEPGLVMITFDKRVVDGTLLTECALVFNAEALPMQETFVTALTAMREKYPNAKVEAFRRGKDRAVFMSGQIFNPRFGQRATLSIQWGGRLGRQDSAVVISAGLAG